MFQCVNPSEATRIIKESEARGEIPTMFRVINEGCQALEVEEGNPIL